jgi:hypothetical protein
VRSSARGSRRARLLVSGAAVAAVAAAALLALLVAGLVARAGPVPALFHGLLAVGTGGLAVGLLVLARAGALARRRAAERARVLCNRCLVGALLAAVVVVLFGVLSAPSVGSSLPVWGGAVAGVLLALLVGLALRLRPPLGAAGASQGRRYPPGGDGESEPDRAAGAR